MTDETKEKSSCFSEKGCRERQRSIDTHETGIAKACMAGAFIICSITCFVVGGTQTSRAINATSINDDFEGQIPQLDNAYDSCVVGGSRFGSNGFGDALSSAFAGLSQPSSSTYASGLSDDIYQAALQSSYSSLSQSGSSSSAYNSGSYSSAAGLTSNYGQSSGSSRSSGIEGTGWTFVWQFNAAIMIIMGANYIVMAIGAFNFKVRLGSTIFNCVLALLNIIGSIIAFSALTGPGDYCNLNVYMISEYDGDGKWVEDGHTYSDEAGLIFVFAVIQIILGSCQVIYCGCPLFMTKVVPDEATPDKSLKYKTKKDKRKKRRDEISESESQSQSQSEVSEQVLESVDEEPRRKKPKRKLNKKRSKSLRNNTSGGSGYSMDEIPVVTNNRRKSASRQTEPFDSHPPARNGKAVIHLKPQYQYDEEDDYETDQQRRKRVSRAATQHQQPKYKEQEEYDDDEVEQRRRRFSRAATQPQQPKYKEQEEYDDDLEHQQRRRRSNRGGR